MDLYNIIKERQDKVVAEIARYGLQKQIFPEMSKIRLRLPLRPNTGQYVFNIKDQNTDHITTFGLDRNDVFIPNLWGVRIVFRNTVTGEIRPYTFAPQNDGVNPSVYKVGFTDASADAIFDGNVQWILDNNVVMSAYPMEYFKHIPETQGLFVLDSNDAPINEGIQLQHDINKELELLYTKYNICGTRDHKITVFFDAAGKSFALASDAQTGDDVAANWEPDLELLMLGFLVKGGCQQFPNGSPYELAAGNW